MSKSLEALDKIVEKYDWLGKEYCQLIGKGDELHKVNQTAFVECLVTPIKQDLERYHNALQEQYDYSTCRCYDELLFRCKHLEKENQELKRYKEKAILYDKACNKDKSANKIIVDLDYLENLQNEERKFGFAIEILARVANIKTEKHLTRLYEHKYISQEDYELLKEVLCDDKRN